MSFPHLAAEGAIKVAGFVENFRDELKVKVSRLRRAKDEEIELSDMLRCSERNLDLMKAVVWEAIDSVENEHLC